MHLEEYFQSRNRKFADKTKHALRRVIVDGVSQKLAAEEVGIMKQQLWMAIRSYKHYEAQKNASDS